jgi:hypothetical protein
MSTSEQKPLISSSQAQVAAAAGATILNEGAAKIKKATQNGPLSFRIMGFIGGIAMIVSNGLGIVDRFMSFNFTGSLIAIYGCLFGVMSESAKHSVRCPPREREGRDRLKKSILISHGFFIPCPLC